MKRITLHAFERGHEMQLTGHKSCEFTPSGHVSSRLTATVRGFTSMSDGFGSHERGSNLCGKPVRG